MSIVGSKVVQTLHNNCVKEPAENKTIAVIDDTDIVAQSVKDFLGIAGYTDVLVFTDPKNALSEIQKKVCPAIIVADFEMPELNGIQLLDAVIAVHPETVGIIITGNPSRALAWSKKYPVLAKGTAECFCQLIRLVDGYFHSVNKYHG